MKSKIVLIFLAIVSFTSNGMFTRLPMHVSSGSIIHSRGTVLSRTIPSIVQKRPLSTLERLKNYASLPAEMSNVSLALGAARYGSGMLERMYEVDSDSSGIQLIKALYFRRQPGERIRASALKSNPAYSLTPSVLGLVMGALEAHTIKDVNVRSHIVSVWRAEHSVLTNGDPITKKKVEGLIDLIVEVYNNDTNNARAVLLSFLYAKANPHNNEDSINFFETFTRYNPAGASFIDSLQLLSQSYTGQDYDRVIENLERLKGDDAIEYIKNNFEVAIATIMNKVQISSLYPPAVIPLKYGYHGKAPRPNCVEAALHDMFNIILFNPQLQSFDLSLLPDHNQPHSAFIEFYSVYNNPNNVNYPEVGQAFMDMVSNVSKVDYRQSDYELKAEATEYNIIILANYLLGINAQNLVDLGELLSDHRRHVTFTITGVVDREIAIEVDNVMSGQRVMAEFHFSDNHSWLATPLRNKTTHDYVSIPLSLMDDYNVSPQIQALFGLQPTIDMVHHLAEAMLPSFYYAMNTEHDNSKFLLIKYILMMSADNNEATDYAYHLYKKLSPAALVQIFSIVMQSGVWKTNKKFENIYATLQPQNDEERVRLIEMIVTYNNENQTALDCLYALYQNLSVEFNRATVFKLIMQRGLHKRNHLFKEMYKTLDPKDARSKKVLIETIILHDTSNEEAVEYAYGLMGDKVDMFVDEIMKSGTWKKHQESIQFFALNTYRALQAALNTHVFNVHTIQALYDIVDTDKKSRMLTLAFDAVQHACHSKASYTQKVILSEENLNSVVNLLLSLRCDVNAHSKRTDSLNMTPLLFAIKINNAVLIDLLINHGADIHKAVTSDYFAHYLERISLTTLTPLQWAAKQGSASAVEILLKHGAQVDACDVSNNNNYSTPLVIALLEEKRDVAMLLLKYGADPNIQSKIKGKKISPLDAVLMRLNTDNDVIIAELIQCGVRVNERDDDNNTILDKAFDIYTSRECVHSISKTIKILEAAGAQARKAHYSSFFIKTEQFDGTH